MPENQTLSTQEVREDGKIKDVPNNATIGMRSSLFRTPRVSSIAVIRVRIQEKLNKCYASPQRKQTSKPYLDQAG